MTIITTWSAPPPGFRDQASRLRAMVNATDRPAPVSQAEPSVAAPSAPATAPSAPRRVWTIAIASGKGGVGKTNVAVNLALALADAGVTTTLLDGDLGLANADLLLGLRAGPHLGDVLTGARTLDQICVRVTPRLTLVPGASGIARLADLDLRQRAMLGVVVERLERRSQALILDCGAGIGSGVLSLVGCADQSLIVTTPEPTAIADAYALIKCVVAARPGAERGSGRMSLVVNQAADTSEGKRVHARIAAVCDRFLAYPLPLAGVIEHDERVRAAVRERRPFLVGSPKSNAARSVRLLSGSLIQQMGGTPQSTPSSGSSLSRMLRAFGFSRA